MHAMDPTGGAHDTPQTPSLLGRGHLSHALPHSAPSAPRFSRLWRSPLGAFGTSVWGHCLKIFSSRTAPAWSQFRTAGNRIK